MMPGPRAPTRRPRRNTTARSYSRSTLRPLRTNAPMIAAATNAPGIASLLSAAPGPHPPDSQSETVDARHLDGLAVVDRILARRAPVLAVHHDGPVRCEPPARDADSTDHALAPEGRPGALGAEHERAHGEDDRPEGAGRAEGDTPRQRH